MKALSGEFDRECNARTALRRRRLGQNGCGRRCCYPQDGKDALPADAAHLAVPLKGVQVLLAHVCSIKGCVGAEERQSAGPREGGGQWGRRPCLSTPAALSIHSKCTHPRGCSGRRRRGRGRHLAPPLAAAGPWGAGCGRALPGGSSGRKGSPRGLHGPHMCMGETVSRRVEPLRPQGGGGGA